MHIDEFTNKYGTSQKRLYLINLLKDELQNIVSKDWAFKAYVFGSVVNSDVENPNDIDCLFSVSNSLYSGAWQPITSTNEIHAWPSCIKFDRSILYSSCLRLEDMVHAFNSSNQRVGDDIAIEPFMCVEVTT